MISTASAASDTVGDAFVGSSRILTRTDDLLCCSCPEAVSGIRDDLRTGGGTSSPDDVCLLSVVSSELITVTSVAGTLSVLLVVVGKKMAGESVVCDGPKLNARSHPFACITGSTSSRWNVGDGIGCVHSTRNEHT